MGTDNHVFKMIQVFERPARAMHFAKKDGDSIGSVPKKGEKMKLNFG